MQFSQWLIDRLRHRVRNCESRRHHPRNGWTTQSLTPVRDQRESGLMKSSHRPAIRRPGGSRARNSNHNLRCTRFVGRTDGASSDARDPTTHPVDPRSQHSISHSGRRWCQCRTDGTTHSSEHGHRLAPFRLHRCHQLRGPTGQLVRQRDRLSHRSRVAAIDRVAAFGSLAAHRSARIDPRGRNPTGGLGRRAGRRRCSEFIDNSPGSGRR